MQGDQMSRNFILVSGALLWATFAVSSMINIAIGNWIAPAIAAMAGVASVAFFRVRRARRAIPVTP